MKKLLLCFLVLLSCHFSYSQKQDYNWCFPDSCALLFSDSTVECSTSAASFDTSFLSCLENAASISDSNGNLLFYTNGSIVWNKNHQQMAHGLHSNTSVTQGSLILPKPNDSSIYYLFHLNPGSLSAAVYYALIDMSLANGLGDVIPGKKNVQLYEGGYDIGEKLAAVKHANGRDWWVVTHAADSAIFRIYLLTPDTILLGSNQSVGADLYPGYYIFYGGEMIFSQSGSKLALVGQHGLINMFDFDRCTGMISNFVDLSVDNFFDEGYYGCSFSPDDSKFYVSYFDALFQFNLTDSNILGSKTLIWNNPYYTGGLFDWNLGQHQLAPNGKIYIVLNYFDCSPGVPDTFIDKNLSAINKPNEEGLACDFVPDALYLCGHHAGGGLPNSPNYNLGALEGSPCDTLSIPTLTSKLETPNLNLSPNPTTSSFNITYTIQQPAILTITNAYGIAVKQLTLYPYFKNRIVYVDDLSEGIYLVTMREGNKISSKKIIVER